MGCVEIKHSEVQITLAVKSIAQGIDNDSCSRLKDDLGKLAELMKCSMLELKDKEIIKHKEMKFSLLSYCLWNNKPVGFAYCVEQIGCSIEKMEKAFQDIHLSPINYVCENNFTDTLRVYLPYYLEYLERLDCSQRSFGNRLKKIKDNYAIGSNAVQLACYAGNISILCYIFEYFRKITPPNELNIHYIDDQTGENCALIGCRVGNLALLKVLHERFHANFHLKNYKKQGALDIMIEASLASTEKFLNCFIYLIEVVRVNPGENFESLIERISDVEIINYLQCVNKLFTITKSNAGSIFSPNYDSIRQSRFTFGEDVSEIIKSSFELTNTSS